MILKQIKTIVFLLSFLVNAVYGANVEIQETSFSKIEGNMIYYLDQAKLNIPYSNLNNNLTIYLDNVAKHTDSQTGSYLLTFPTTQNFNLKIFFVNHFT